MEREIDTYNETNLSWTTNQHDINYWMERLCKTRTWDFFLYTNHGTLYLSFWWKTLYLSYTLLLSFSTSIIYWIKLEVIQRCFLWSFNFQLMLHLIVSFLLGFTYILLGFIIFFSTKKLMLCHNWETNFKNIFVLLQFYILNIGNNRVIGYNEVSQLYFLNDIKIKHVVFNY